MRLNHEVEDNLVLVYKSMPSSLVLLRDFIRKEVSKERPTSKVAKGVLAFCVYQTMTHKKPRRYLKIRLYKRRFGLIALLSVNSALLGNGE